MIHRKIYHLLGLLLSVQSALLFASTANTEIQHSLQSIVSDAQAQSELVALGAAVSKSSGPVYVAVAGERQVNSQVQVTPGDKWHLGSVTKSITATMIARLVEKDVLRWDTKLSEIFSDQKIHSGWRDVTVSMLLTHTSGAKANFPWSIQSLHPEEGPERQSLRKREVLMILAKKPSNKPGVDFEYSNVGYTIAGVIAEIQSGKSWEDLIRKEIFEPLKLNSGGFGPPVDSNDNLEQPRGHEDSWFSGPKAVSTKTDNSPIMGPAGSIHLSLQDLITYANQHLAGSRGDSVLLTKASFDRLHRMGPEDYAYGWIAARKTDWVDNRAVLYHNGTNTYWYALLVMIPELHMSIAVTTNDGNLSAAQKTAWQVVKQIKAAIPEEE